MDRRQQLLGWIEATKRTQRRLAIVLVALAALSAGLAAWSKPAGAFASSPRRPTRERSEHLRIAERFARR